jgi:hypothetical protein
MKNIGFANVPVDLADIDTQFTVVLPDDKRTATVCKWPWFPAERINKKI